MIFRISNVYGTGCKPYYNSAISTFIDLILNGQKIMISGNGNNHEILFIYQMLLKHSQNR
jgi:nucleoside-diphosphate-sugar epimerase